ncbi:RidA family protein [Hwanghaeella grinnelliae]|uniref:RidA family protein n=1 Tax=Hwanghaeella grinnelliae TaxID=2500179 RepID=A0A3S3UNG0_9PROT|nr:RidA family protein [Hwanghaeella grinnelliae]RVU36092.1 RidA family protein [Hwanghaeella grinnelliae]
MKQILEPKNGRCSAVISEGLVYAVATDPECADGIADQTRNTLQDLERLLVEAGSGKSGLLQATVYLSDVSEKPAMDKVWRDWVGPVENWPQRACVGVDLDDGYLIEVVVVAKTLS